ncbi:MAG: TonB-dependent receptor, partial [Bacteroidales bacterium]|nr:TonB-dependent receptor [Bacteroidales bacterium]
PFSIEKTEVVFGPGSVIYGSDAIGGVMSFYTLKPKLLPTYSNNEKSYITGSAIARYSTANKEKTGHFNINFGLKKWAFLTSASYSEYDDLKMGSNGPDDYLRPEYASRINGTDTILPNSDPEIQKPTAYNQLNFMQKIRFNPNEKWDINYGFHYSTTSNFPRYDRLIRYKNDKLRSAEWYYGPQVWMMNSLNIIHNAKNKAFDILSLNLAHQFFEESRHDRDFGKTDLIHRTDKVNVLSANLDFEKGLSDKHYLNYGLEALLNKVDSKGESENIITGESVPDASRYPDGSTWDSYAAYFTYKYLFSNKITFQAGARYNYVLLNSDFDTTFYPFPFTTADVKTGALNGSVGIAYRPSETWQVNLNLSTGFRAPNIDDVGKMFDSEPGSVVVPNPNLKPEYAYNAELGTAKTFRDIFKIDLTGYYTILENALVRRDYTLNGMDSIMYDGEMSHVQAIQNAADAYVYGFHAGLEVKLIAGWSLSSRFNYQKGEEELDDGIKAPLRHAAPWFGSTHIQYMRDRFKIDFYGVYNGEVSNSNLAPSEQGKTYMYAMDENGKPYSPSWYTLNVKAMYQITDFLMINGGIENITDQRYKSYASGIAGPGRNFIASLKVSF